MRNVFTLGLIALGLAGVQLYATVQVTKLVPSVTSPQPLGTTVTFTATATDTSPGPLAYRFSVGLFGNYSVVRDFSTSNTFSFTPVRREGDYDIQVTAVDELTGEQNTTVTFFGATSRLVNGQAAVNPTPNPLVALYSAPPCPSGSDISIVYLQAGTSKLQRTDWRACQPTVSNNFYIAGLYPHTVYYLSYVVETGGSITAQAPKVLGFQTGTPTETFVTVTDPLAPTSQADPAENIVLHGFISTFPFATDTAGNPVWYYKAAADAGASMLITRLVAHGTMLMITNGEGYSNPTVVSDQILREIDLAGNTVRETNASRITRQVLALGAANGMTAFSHDAIRLTNGDTVVLGSTEKIFPAGTQGSTAPVDILGDMIVVLDSNWQVIWYWDAFDYLDITRRAVLGETCTNGQGGCPPVLLASIANDWLHGNSLYYMPVSGDLLYSSRHQDWLYKIDYNNGAGSKNILWRMGLDGDFTINSSDPYPWFSHQHNASFEMGGTTLLTLFDDGNTRVSPPPNGLGSGNSRGQVLSVNETNMTVSLPLNVDLGVYSSALGSAQLTVNGLHMFQPGTIAALSGASQTIEVSSSGTQVFNQQGPTSYRSFLLPNLYSPPSN